MIGGERTEVAEGFGKADGKTTIFDYWGVPVVQAWTHHGRFDGAGLDSAQWRLRHFYQKLLMLTSTNAVLANGDYQELRPEGLTKHQFAFLRFDQKNCLWVLANFDHIQSLQTTLMLSSWLTKRAYTKMSGLLGGGHQALPKTGVPVLIAPGGFQLWALQ